MSFFDKLFSNRNRNNNNSKNAFEPHIKGLSFTSSHLSIPKNQIRFVLFRECDKRGRKLLFDSCAVEKIPLPSTQNMCKLKCQQQTDKSADFIETNNTHGYKYKKPPSDVSSLGEMVFGSVAVIHKAENSCKIHCIPSPKKLMFTTIVHAPCHRSPSSIISELNMDHSSGSSLTSLRKILSQQTSSSDSKLYKREGCAQKYSSTYPWIKQNFPINNSKQCCEVSDFDFNLTTKFLQGSNSELSNTDSLCLDKETLESERDFSVFSKNLLCLGQRGSEFEGNSNCGSSGITSNESENISSFSGSLSSLRRRWAHSYSTSLCSTTYEDGTNSPSKKRTKLGMALILDLSNTLEDEIEKFLFNHTIIIDSIMYKLQDSVELAYIRNENFVDLIYTAFLECQDSIHELITGKKYEAPIWSMVLGEPDDVLERELTFMGTNLSRTNLGSFTKVDLTNNMQLKFLNDFCDVLVKFDTKDTNFFISTLLTAVLTHHLSWVSTVAEPDGESSSENLSVINNIRPYNPIWAQLNDLCGLLGSPLKSAKTVVTGPESKKEQLANIIEVLTYFVRCNNVVENIYDVDIEDIIGNVELLSETTNLEDSAKAPNECDNAADAKPHCDSTVYGSEAEKSSDEDVGCGKKMREASSRTAETGLKRSKSVLSHIKLENRGRGNELYPDIKELAESENVHISDLKEVENERTIYVEEFLSSEKLREKIQKMIRVPSNSRQLHAEGYLSPDEGYDTIDSTKTDNYRENKVQMERQRSAPAENRKENIVFLLGENEELVNLQKKVIVNKSSFVDMEREETKNRCTLAGKESERDERTLNESRDRTLWVNHGSEHSVEHSSGGEELASVTTPWIIGEFPMPRTIKPCRTRRLEVSSVLGGVNQRYKSEQIIQGVLEPMNSLEETLQKDLFLSAHNPILEKKATEAVCVVGDMESWEVTVYSSKKSVLDCKKQSGVRVGMSQLVADMLESFLCLHTSNLPPSFCLGHIEKKLHEIYFKSKLVAELLNSEELCSIDYLTTSLDIGINDVPLLMSVATTHSPLIAEKYVLSYS